MNDSSPESGMSLLIPHCVFVAMLLYAFGFDGPQAAWYGLLGGTGAYMSIVVADFIGAKLLAERR